MHLKNAQDLFKANLKRLRTLKGLTQAQLAELCGLSSNYIMELETGRRFPSPDTLDAVSEALEVEVFELFLIDDIAQHKPHSEPISVYKERLKRRLNEFLETFE